MLCPKGGRSIAAAALPIAAAVVAVTAQVWAPPASANTPAASAPPAVPAPSSPATVVKLIELLIQNGVLTRQQADALLKQAEAEATQAARPPAPASVPAPGGIEAPEAPPGTVRVPYIPESVKRQIKDELRQEVTQDAKEQGWAEPSTVPEWLDRFKIYGNVRTRYQGDFQDHSNAPLVNYYQINQGNGVNPNAEVGTFPLVNTTEDRAQYLLQARLGVEAKIDDWVSTDVRLATGNTDSPVSTNQALGDDGNFPKYDIWLDRAYIKMTPAPWVEGDVGRMPNPFISTDLLFDYDLNFDGVAAKFSYPIDEDSNIYFNGGGFPVFNTAFNFPGNSVDKVNSRDKYLFAGQVGADHKFDEKYKATGAIGYYWFDNINGKTSSPCLLLLSNSNCDTDSSRPQFQQKGNTLFPIRNLTPTPTEDQLQYYGYASEFGILDLYGRMDIAEYHPVDVILEGEFLNNLLFDKTKVQRKDPVNNLAGQDFDFDGGSMGFLLRATVGDEDVDALWDWSAWVAYKYLESDAVVDAFTDSDFHLGGTNAKGFILGGRLGIAKDTFIALRWLTADEVSGPPLSIDVLQIDLNAKF